MIHSDPAILRELAKAAAAVEKAQERLDKLTLVREALTWNAYSKKLVRDIDASKALGLETYVYADALGRERERAPAYWARIRTMKERLEG